MSGRVPATCAPVLAIALGLVGGGATWAQDTGSPGGPDVLAPRGGTAVDGDPGAAAGDTGLFDPILSDALRHHLAMAEDMESQGQWRRAEAAYDLVLGRDPTYVPAVLGLGRVREARGDIAGAIAAYERLDTEADAVEALAMLVEQDDPARSATLYRRLTTLKLGDPGPHRALARVLTQLDPSAAAEELDIYIQLIDLDARDPDGRLMLQVAIALRLAGDEEGAIATLERLLALVPEGEHTAEARGRLDRIGVERAARVLAVGGAEPLSDDLKDKVEGARRRSAGGDHEAALALLREVVQRAPRSAQARAALGDVHVAMGQTADAERAYAWAAALEPDGSAWHARLGILLADRYGGRRHREAAEELERAMALRPSWAELHFRLAGVYQQMGRWDSAVTEYQAYVSAEPDGPFTERASSELVDLTRTAPEPPQVPTGSAPPADVSADALDRYRVARVYLDRGELDRARVELAAVLPLAPGWPAAINLQAALQLREGDVDAAAASWDRSLEIEQQQPQVRLALGELRRQQGRMDEARDLFSDAARGGAADAWYKLAVLAYEDRQLFVADRYLTAYFETSTGGLSHEPALDLRDRVERRIRNLQLGGSGFFLLALAGAGTFFFRRRRAATMADLIAEVPEVAHDLARLLSAIRHEVLKHNTTLLDEVAHALEHGDHHAVAFAAVRLYGEPGEGGIIDRFDAYLASITRLGRRHGVRLDLKRKDRVLAPMWRAMKRLRGLRRALRRPWRARPSVATELRSVSKVLNDTGYRALGRLVREMGTIGIDADLLGAVNARVRAEPGFGDRDLPMLELDVPSWSVPARVFRGDLEDIVANLLRNAYGALDGTSGARIGLVLDEEDDPITGLEEVVLRFVDNAPGTLTDQMIKSRGIGRGLGLVVELIARHEGSIRVEQSPVDLARGWTKAVAVRLPRAEVEGGDRHTPEGGGAVPLTVVVEEDEA